MLHIVRSSRCSDFDYAQDDTAGRENIKIYAFLRAIRESPLQLMGLVRILGERTYFVGVGALDDPKNNQ
jgi:hypothetical protein